MLIHEIPSQFHYTSKLSAIIDKCVTYSYGTGDTVTDIQSGVDSTVIWGPTELMGDERYIMFRYINIYFDCLIFTSN